MGEEKEIKYAMDIARESFCEDDLKSCYSTETIKKFKKSLLYLENIKYIPIKFNQPEKDELIKNLGGRVFEEPITSSLVIEHIIEDISDGRLTLEVYIDTDKSYGLRYQNTNYDQEHWMVVLANSHIR